MGVKLQYCSWLVLVIKCPLQRTHVSCRRVGLCYFAVARGIYYILGHRRKRLGSAEAIAGGYA